MRMPVSALAGAALGERFDDLALGDCAVCATPECPFEFGLQQSQPLDARPHVREMAAGNGVRIRAGRVTVPFPVTSTLLVVTTLLLAVAACGEAIGR